eukprot:549373-Rhodomonas_salina.1
MPPAPARIRHAPCELALPQHVSAYALPYACIHRPMRLLGRAYAATSPERCASTRWYASRARRPGSHTRSQYPTSRLSQYPASRNTIPYLTTPHHVALYGGHYLNCV